MTLAETEQIVRAILCANDHNSAKEILLQRCADDRDFCDAMVKHGAGIFHALTEQLIEAVIEAQGTTKH